MDTNMQVKMEYRFPTNYTVDGSFQFSDTYIKFERNEVVSQIKRYVDVLDRNKCYAHSVRIAWEMIKELESFIQVQSTILDIDGVLYGIEVLLDSQLEGE